LREVHKASTSVGMLFLQFRRRLSSTLEVEATRGESGGKTSDTKSHVSRLGKKVVR